MTNGEKIRNMTDEELASFLFGTLCDCGCNGLNLITRSPQNYIYVEE